ncbi:hypothetical protein DFH28DRAFT_1033849 [Melampsora americana]|nr:hypothetical protein DFH28DRAFT_1033849 [Melampsora americana]
MERLKFEFKMNQKLNLIKLSTNNTKKLRNLRNQSNQSKPNSSNWFNRTISPYGFPIQTDPILFPINPTSTSTSTFIKSNQTYSQRNSFPSTERTFPIPKLSASIASLHNAALVHLHRGLALPIDHPDAFQSAIIKGFYQIYKLDTGLEYSIRREDLIKLLNLVRIKYTTSFDTLNQTEWNACCEVLILTGTRPSISSIGEWAWESISKHQIDKLLKVWNGIKDSPKRKRFINSSNDSNFGPGTSSKIEDDSSQDLISLDGQFFTALIAVSAIMSNGPKLETLITSLLETVSSTVQWPNERYINQLPDPNRVKYFIRSIELALIWKRPQVSSSNSLDELGLEIETDERIIRYMRRTFRGEKDGGRRSAEDLWCRIREAVDGPELIPNEDGWLKLDWKEPMIHLNSSNLIEDGTVIEEDLIHRPEQTVSRSIKKASKPLLLTQRIVGVFLTTFARLGALEKVEEVIKFVRLSCGGMSLYLWASILRGLAWRQDYDLTKRFYDRMRNEDGIEPDLNVSCLMISTSFGSSSPGAVDVGLAAVDTLLLKESTKSSGCPTEALNIIISSLLRHKLIERAEELMKKLKTTNLNTTTLNHFLNFHSKYQDLNGVLVTLKRFEKLSIQPDVVSFTILLNVLMKLGCGRNGAKKLLEMMEKLGVKANAITYGSIVHHLCRSGEVEELEIAAGLVDEIEQKGIATTAITYTALIQGYLRAYVNEHRSSNSKPSSEKFTQAMKLINRMKSHGHQINEVIEHALLDTFLSTHQISEGIEFFKESCRKDLDSYGILLRRLKELGQIGLAKEVVKDLRRKHQLIPRWIERIVLDIEHSW